MIGSRIAFDDGMSQFTGIVVKQTDDYIDVAFDDCDTCNEIIPSTRITNYNQSLEMGFIKFLDRLSPEMKDQIVKNFCELEDHTPDMIDIYFLAMFGDQDFLK